MATARAYVIAIKSIVERQRSCSTSEAVMSRFSFARTFSGWRVQALTVEDAVNSFVLGACHLTFTA
ncbi:MAG: hypothetical protein WC054_03940 [Candidatus Nanopelagicales bacterium]